MREHIYNLVIKDKKTKKEILDLYIGTGDKARQESFDLVLDLKNVLKLSKVNIILYEDRHTKEEKEYKI